MVSENSGPRPGEVREEEGGGPSPENEGGQRVRREAHVLGLGGRCASY